MHLCKDNKVFPDAGPYVARKSAVVYRLRTHRTARV